MRVLLVVTKGDLGGAQKRIIDLAEYYVKEGIEVQVAAGEGEYLPARLRKKDIDFHRFTNLKRSKNPLSLLLYTWELHRYLDQHHFDIVHLNSSNALAGVFGVSMLRRPPKTVFTFRGMSLISEHAPISLIWKFFYTYFFKKAVVHVDAAIFQCEADRKHAHSLGIEPRNEKVIVPGINEDDLDFFTRTEARKIIEERIGVSFRGKFIVGSIGRLSQAKNYNFLLKNFTEALKTNPKHVLIIIGDGPEMDSLSETIYKNKALLGRVFLVGERKQAYKLIPAFDLFVLPSHYEGVSMTLTEAMFAGVPILASDVGGSREIVYDKRMLYKANDTRDFMRKFRRITKDSKLRKELSKGLRDRKKRFTLSRSASEYLDLYKNLIAQKS